jgi:hypothetical protein
MSIVEYQEIHRFSAVKKSWVYFLRLKPKCTTGKERRVTCWEYEAVLEAMRALSAIRPRYRSSQAKADICGGEGGGNPKNDRYQFKALLVVRIVSLVRRPESISH